VCDKSDFLTSPTLFTVKCPTNLDRLLSSCFDTQTKLRLLIFAKHSMNNQSSMTPTAAQQSLPLFNLHRTVALQAIHRARCAPGTDALRFGVQTGEINLQQLLLLPYRDRNAIVERGLLSTSTSARHAYTNVHSPPYSSHAAQMLVAFWSRCAVALRSVCHRVSVMHFPSSSRSCTCSTHGREACRGGLATTSCRTFNSPRCSHSLACWTQPASSR
jgi:hypothetical protein